MKKEVYGFSVIIIIVIILFFIKLNNSGGVRVGKVDSNFPKLENGVYEVKNLKINVGEYSIYCLEGSGNVVVDGKEYSLTDDDYKEASKQIEQTKYAVLYENGKKINLNENSEIIVDGTDNFKISFLKR